MSRKISLLACALLSISATFATTSVQAKDTEITIIHTGDFHGHMIPRANVRSDSVKGRKEGGLARVATVIQQIRAKDKNALFIHTGDTIQGGAEVLFTRGQAIVDVLNMPEFGIDAFAPGNWEFVYGTQRFAELFAGATPTAPWGAIAANLFASKEGAACSAGERPIPAYKIKMVGKVKVGILGLTTDRGPQIVGSSVTKGFCFLKNGTELDTEVALQVAHLRNEEKVNILVLASEMGLANNIRIAEKIDGIDVVLSSDMHETTGKAVVVTNATSGRKTILLEEGQDGTMMGKLTLKVKDNAVSKWEWKAIRVDDSIAENKKVAAKIAQIRAGFTGENYADKVNPFNGAMLKRPIDAIVGTTTVALHRSNFSNENMPAVLEGSSHDFIADAFKAMTGADIGAIRGFRYGTHVAVGPIRYEDLFHFMPIGAQIASAKLPGQAIKNQIENAADGSLNPDVAKWTGGWLFNFSGVTMDFDPYQSLIGAAPYALDNGRAFNIKVNGADLAFQIPVPVDAPAGTAPAKKSYSYASYWYAIDPCKLNTIDVPGCTVDSTTGAPSNVTILKDSDGKPLDGTEVLVKYLESLKGPANPVLNRITLKDKTSGKVVALPAAKFGNPEVQPLRGAQH